VVSLVRARAQTLGARTSDVRFTRKELRDATGWSDTQLRLHLDRLADLEYLAAHREGAGGKFVYELVYDGACDEKPHLSGLIDIATMRKSRGADGEVAPRSRGDRGPVAGGSREGQSSQTLALARLPGRLPSQDDKTHVSVPNNKSASYPQALPLAAAHA